MSNHSRFWFRVQRENQQVKYHIHGLIPRVDRKVLHKWHQKNELNKKKQESGAANPVKNKGSTIKPAMLACKLSQKPQQNPPAEGFFNNLSRDMTKWLKKRRGEAKELTQFRRRIYLNGKRIPAEYYLMSVKEKAPPEIGVIPDAYVFYVVEKGVLKIYLSSGTRTFSGTISGPKNCRQNITL